MSWGTPQGPCGLCWGRKVYTEWGNLLRCPSCWGDGFLHVGFEPGQDWPNLGVNMPAGMAVAVSGCCAMDALGFVQIQQASCHTGKDYVSQTVFEGSGISSIRGSLDQFLYQKYGDYPLPLKPSDWEFPVQIGRSPP